MMMALITFLMLSILIGELAYESGVYSNVVWKQVDVLRSNLLARSALRLSILQLKAAEKAKEKAKAMGLSGAGESLTEQIWQTPLILPPPSPPGITEDLKGSIDKFSKSLGLEGKMSSAITAENAKLSLNQMIWVKEKAAPSRGGSGGGSGENPGGSGKGPGGFSGGVSIPQEQTLTPERKQELQKEARKNYGQLLDQVLIKKKENDVNFRDTYGTLTGDTIIGNILAWISPEVTIDGDNRDKNDYYSRLEPDRYSIKNAPLWSESEFPMIKGIDDTIAKLLSETFSVLPVNGINLNDASATMIQGLIPELGEIEIERIMKRRSTESEGGPFKDAQDFWNFLQTMGNYKQAQERIEEQGITLFGKSTSYRITINAESGMAKDSWTVLVGPPPPAIDPQPDKNGKLQQPTQGGGLDISKPLEDEEEGGEKKEKKEPKTDTEPFTILYLKQD